MIDRLNPDMIKCFHEKILSYQTARVWRKDLQELKDRYIQYLLSDTHFMGNEEDAGQVFLLTQLCDFFEAVEESARSKN